MLWFQQSVFPSPRTGSVENRARFDHLNLRFIRMYEQMALPPLSVHFAKCQGECKFSVLCFFSLFVLLRRYWGTASSSSVLIIRFASHQVCIKICVPDFQAEPRKPGIFMDADFLAFNLGLAGSHLHPRNYSMLRCFYIHKFLLGFCVGGVSFGVC